MTTRWTIMVAIGLAWAIGAEAQEFKKFDAVDTVTIVGVDLEHGQIQATDAEGVGGTVLVDEDTSILVGATEVPVAKLAAGDRIMIEARKEMEGEADGSKLIADRILIVVDAPGDSHTGTTLGRVVATDPVESTITLEIGRAGGPYTFQVSSEDVTVEGAPAGLVDVEMGDKVAVDHEAPVAEAGDPVQASGVRVERSSLRPVPGDAAGEPILRDDG